MTDFSKFRESGDLSDISVFVGSKEHRLHKFPLYARSDYFCELARTQPHSDTEPFKVELHDFPGGNDTFVQVADFCYNMPLNLNKKNVVAVRCAAEYLKMYGPGNLKEVSSKFLIDTITSAKINRFTSLIVSMLMECNEVGDVAETAGIVDLCLDAFVECWLKPAVKYSTLGIGRSFFIASQNSDAISGFTRTRTANVIQAIDKLDDGTVRSLLAIRPEWFAKLLMKARVRGISSDELGNLAVKYISSALEEKRKDEEIPSNNALNNQDDEKDIDTNNSTADTESLASHDFDDNETPPVSQNTRTVLKVKYDPKRVLDTVILALPDQAFSIPAVTMEWLTKTISMATLHSCESKDKLLRVAGDMLTQLDSKDLCVISPSVLHDIIVGACEEKCTTGQQMSSEKACSLVDKYMVHKTKEGSLTAEAFRLLASATKNYTRTSHDSLYTVLEFVLNSEADKLTHEQRNELTEIVNFDLLSGASLQRALDEEIVPPAKIASSALKLCVRLRTELASVKYIAELQEDDLQKYQTSVGRAVPLADVEPRQLSSYNYTPRNTELDNKDIFEKSSSEATRSEDQESGNHYASTDPLKAAQSVLSAARHKLNLPVYTGYRPVFLSRLPPSTYSGHAHLYYYHAQRGHDLSLEDELELRLDRPLHSLDPRARHHRLLAQQHRADDSNGHRTYFPYTSHSLRF
ncbi:unnamed protein product [Candidula unifasciata]|uniref:BTB domain-containing protein n=1 Tax=Candidula unifasciata TaxID=100452 RepID=A0A8S3YP21_9EUPU|nr:unnamed protein product [Candidula unifasciata]